MLDLYSKKVLETTKMISNSNPDKIVWSRKWEGGTFILLVIDPIKLVVLETKVLTRENVAPPENWELYECIADAQDTIKQNWDRFVIRGTAEEILDDIQEYDMF